MSMNALRSNAKQRDSERKKMYASRQTINMMPDDKESSATSATLLFKFDPLLRPHSMRLLQQREEEKETKDDGADIPSLSYNSNTNVDDSNCVIKDKIFHHGPNLDKPITQKYESATKNDNAKSMKEQTHIILNRPQEVRNSYRSCFSSTFHWYSKRHYEPDELEPYRLIGDVEIDYMFDQCEKEGIPGPGRFDDIIDVMNEVVASTTALSPAQTAIQNVYNHYHNQVPKWVDWEQLQRGIDTVLITYFPAVALSLFYRSLVPGFAIPKITRVLEETRYLSPPASSQKVAERLFDTGALLGMVAISCSLEGYANDTDGNGVDQQLQSSSSGLPLPASTLRPGGKGWAAALRVRALHAKVRRSIMKKNKRSTKSASEGQYWDTEYYGVPINQEDMAGTLLGFSTVVLNGIEFIAGRSLGKQEQLDYLALWRYLGWLLGVEAIEDDHHGEEQINQNDCCDDTCGSIMTSDSYKSKNEENDTNIESTCDVNVVCQKVSNASVAIRNGRIGRNNLLSLPPLDPCGTRVYPQDSDDCCESDDGNSDDDNTASTSTGSSTRSVKQRFQDDCPIIHSNATLDSILWHLLHPDQSSVRVAHHLLKIGQRAPTHVSQRKEYGGIFKLFKSNNSKTSSSSDEGAITNNGNSSKKECDNKNLRFSFIYRGLLCRRFTGDHLADKLQLPSANCGETTLRVCLAYHLTTLFLLTLRMYTLATMKVTWFRNWAKGFHLRSWQRFEVLWLEKHKKRMIAAKVSVISKSDTRRSDSTKTLSPSLESNAPKNGKVDDGNDCQVNDESRVSFCPFALVMPPSSE